MGESKVPLVMRTAAWLFLTKADINKNHQVHVGLTKSFVMLNHTILNSFIAPKVIVF